MTDILLAGHLQLDIADGAETVTQYVTGPTGETIEVYDLGGPEEAVSPPDRVTLADLGWLIIINADLGAPDVHALLVEGRRDLNAARIDSRWDLETRTPPSPTASTRACSTHGGLLTNIHGIGRTKASKLLHLKAPHAFPLLDAYVVKRYKTSALEMAAELKQPAPMYWAAIRQDLTALRRTGSRRVAGIHCRGQDRRGCRRALVRPSPHRHPRMEQAAEV